MNGWETTRTLSPQSRKRGRRRSVRRQNRTLSFDQQLGACPWACPSVPRPTLRHVTTVSSVCWKLSPHFSRLSAAFFRSRSDTTPGGISPSAAAAEILQTEAALWPPLGSLDSSVLDACCCSSGARMGRSPRYSSSLKTVVGWHRAGFRWYGLFGVPAARRSAKDQRGEFDGSSARWQKKTRAGVPQRSTGELQKLGFELFGTDRWPSIPCSTHSSSG